MQHITSGLTRVNISQPIPQGRGGRVSSESYRQSLEMAEEFAGLPAGVERYDLLKLVKRAGKGAGFSSRMIELLDYYMAFTRDADWAEGSRPIVFQSLSRTSLDLGISERQLQNLENQLFEAGAITWNDSGNHRRYGQRDPKTGRLLYAFGVDLTPLASLKEALEHRLAAKEARDAAWMETKRRISWYRRQCKALIAEGQGRGLDTRKYEEGYTAVAIAIRTHLDMQRLNSLLDEHKQLYEEIRRMLESESGQGDNTQDDSKMTIKTSSRGEEDCAHYNFTNQELPDKSDTGSSPANIDFRESVTRPVAGDRHPPEQGNSEERTGAGGEAPDHTGEEDMVTATGLQHITLKQALNAASSRLREQLPLNAAALSWADMVDAAWKLRPVLGISQKSWGEACRLLGRTGAAVCLILTDQAAQREQDRVMKPGAYFRAMVNKARTRELHLHKSIFGILKRESVE